MCSKMRYSAPGLALAMTFWFGCNLTTQAGDWPQWRGVNRDGHTVGEAPLNSFPADPSTDWKLTVGGGFSSPVVAGKVLVYQDEKDGREWAHAVDAESGKELWTVTYSPAYSDEWGSGPRATPIMDGERVYVQSCVGEFCCLKLGDGSTIWRTSFEKDFGVKFGGSKAQQGTAARRGNNGCAVIDGERIIVPVGAPKGFSLVCFDKKTGRQLWHGGDDEAGYSSFITATLAGVRQTVAFTADSLLGARQEDGKVLWRVPLVTNAKRHASTPVILQDTVFVNSHSFGLLGTRVESDSGGQKATRAWQNKELLINISTPVLVGQHLYTLGANRDYVCVDARTGEAQWSKIGFGRGRKDYASTVVVGNRLLILTEEGELFLLAANPEKYEELGRLHVCGSTWNYPAYANGRLYVRDGKELRCLNIADSPR